MEEFGIFNWMLMHAWNFSEKPAHLPNNPEEIAWMIRIDKQMIINSLSKWKKWVETEDKRYIYNPKQLSIYNGLLYKSNVLSNNRLGKKKQKKNKRKTNEQQIGIGIGNDNGIDNNKKKHLDQVYLTDDEYGKLIEKYGKDKADECITFLDGYLENNPKKQRQYKSHYKCILTWVYAAVQERRGKESKGGSGLW